MWNDDVEWIMDEVSEVKICLYSMRERNGSMRRSKVKIT